MTEEELQSAMTAEIEKAVSKGSTPFRNDDATREMVARSLGPVLEEFLPLPTLEYHFEIDEAARSVKIVVTEKSQIVLNVIIDPETIQ